MAKKQTKRGETTARIYKLLHRNPDMTTNEIAAYLPDATPSMVQTSVSRMFQRGQIGSRGKKSELCPSGRLVSHKTYHVKYNYQPEVKSKPKQKPKVRRAPIVEAPKPVVAAPPPTPKVEPEGPKTPKAEREVLVLRHIADIYKALSLMTDQQDALIEVLKGTLADLAETKEELERERQRRNWWDKFKGLFS